MFILIMMITMNLIFRKYAQIASAAVSRIEASVADVSIQYAQFYLFLGGI